MGFSVGHFMQLPGVRALPATLGKGLRRRDPLGDASADFRDLLSATIGAIVPLASKPAQRVVSPPAEPPVADARSTLKRTSAAALAPPGAGPPPQRRTSGEKIGQKNEFSGQLLDAKPAKEPPALKKTQRPTEPPADAVRPAPRTPLHAAAASATASAQRSQAAAAAPAAPPQRVPNVLARIVARAASAAAQHGVSPQNVTAPKATLANASANAAFEKLAAQIAQAATAGPNTAAHAEPETNRDLAHNDSGSRSSSQPQTVIAAQHTVATPFADSPHLAKGAAPATVDVNAVIEQLVKSIAIRNVQGSSQIRLRLQPEHLGEVAIKLTVSGENVSASVVAQDAAVRDVLATAQPQLSRSLSDAGLTLNTFSVDVSGGYAGSPNDRHASAQRSPEFKLGGWHAGGAPLNDSQAIAEERFGPPLRGAGSLLFDSLV